MPHRPKVGIIVLNYNGKDCLLACLDSLSHISYANKEIIVVDNGSSDDSLAQAKKRFPKYIFIENKENFGFAKGMNIGMKQALLTGAIYCLLFNYDAEIDPHALSLLIAAGEAYPHAGLLSPVIYEKESRKIWFAQGKILFSRMRAVHIQPSLEEQKKRVYASEFLTGCALLVKKELMEKIGFLDEQFFLYYEDVDYSLRAKQAGFDRLVVSEANVYHSEKSRNNPQKTFFLVFSGLLFFSKHASLIFRLYMAIYVTIRRVKNAFDRNLRKTPASQEVYRAYKNFFHEHSTSHFPYFC